VGRVFLSLGDEEFNRLFLDFRYTAYRLETLQRYDVAYEKNEFSRFLSGESRGTFPGISEWIDNTVVKAVAAGKRIHRVHIVETPLSDYIRFECAWAYEHTVTAGEDVRIIVVSAGEWPELPHFDYWLFDSSLLIAMSYDEEGTFTSAEIVEEPSTIVEANRWRDVAIGASTAYRDFAGKFDSQFQPSLRK
jgi:hypothetical protein